LKKQITTYLKNARSEPEKSIPQTFQRTALAVAGASLEEV
jgi:hypothetical protein